MNELCVRPAAERLKGQGVEFYTFGIRNGNVKVGWQLITYPCRLYGIIINEPQIFIG